MVDIHILKNLLDNLWWDQCLDSFKAYKDVLNPIIINNEGRGLIEGRRVGYESGYNDYVGFVDDDDYLIGSKRSVVAVQNLVQEIEERRLLASFTNSTVLELSGKTYPWIPPEYKEWTLETKREVRAHQLMIIRRDVALTAYWESVELVKSHSWHPMVFDSVFINYVTHRWGWNYCTEPVYVWRHSGGARRNLSGGDHQKVTEYFS